jgi:hypothetical protein
MRARGSGGNASKTSPSQALGDQPAAVRRPRLPASRRADSHALLTTLASVSAHASIIVRIASALVQAPPGHARMALNVHLALLALEHSDDADVRGLALARAP